MEWRLENKIMIHINITPTDTEIATSPSIDSQYCTDVYFAHFFYPPPYLYKDTAWLTSVSYSEKIL